ncbi:amidohydrolase family protein [uncultured Chitinophaga sp.]|uniref:amidohydrolase family protein n=1 Tax=uncultured Chitinophaga sp. TaxID=339340 RepID=UPI0025E38C68|nr:amidohydrolase family protein [uncultured Chitinophaga sp.]
MLARILPFVALCLITISASAQKPAILIKAGRLYDAEKNVFTNNQQVLIEGSKIKAVGPDLQVPAGTTVLDMPGATLTPGLIDAHTHLLLMQRASENLAVDAFLNSPERRVLRAASFARSYLESGFTAIRDLGNSGYYLDLEVASAINRGYIPGPKMWCSGPILSAIDGQFYQLPYADRVRVAEKEYRLIRGEEDAVQAVKEHVNNSVNVIKVVAFGERMGVTLAELKAIVKTAHEQHLPVTAHSTGGESLNMAIEAGVDGIEHAYYIADSLLAKMKRKGIYMVPTDPSFQSVIEAQKSQNITIFDTAGIRKELSPLSERLLRAHKAGVKIVAGSDAYTELQISRGDAAKQTIQAYVEEGLSAADALKAATINAAEALGQKGNMGVIKPGATADIAIFGGDLEKNFSKTLFNVSMVIKDGKIVYTKEK